MDVRLKRAEVLSAQANGITLLVISALIAFEAVSRLIRPLPASAPVSRASRHSVIKLEYKFSRRRIAPFSPPGAAS